MKIEIMYPEFISYGETETVAYFEKLFPEADFYYCRYKDRPYFADHEPDMIFFGPMAEYNIEKIYFRLLPFKDRLKTLIDQGTFFLALNNALDLFGRSLEVKNGPEAHSLGLFPYRTVRDYDDRISKPALVKFENQYITGSILGFSNYYGNEDHYYYTAVYPEMAFNRESVLGGFRYKNAFLCELAGGVFLMNPYLAKRLRKHFMGDDQIPLESAMTYTYEENLKLMSKNKEYANRMK